MMKSVTVSHVGRRQVSLTRADLPAIGDQDLLIKSHCSAISPGTESMVFQGLFPTDSLQDQTIRSLAGTFDYPFSYGYALAGEVIDAGPNVTDAWRGRRVIAFHPHCDYAIVHEGDCHPIPDDIPTTAALFLPNMESALGIVMDAAPTIGERIVVLGQGIVGLLTTWLLSAFPFTDLITAEPLQFRRIQSLEFGARQSVDSSDSDQWQALKNALFGNRADGGSDLTIEVSGNPAALNQAIEVTGFDGRILVGSWYGTATPPVDLGGHFHRRRQRLIASQVSNLAPALTGRWNKARRIATAWQAIRECAPERLITHTFDMAACQQAFDLVSRRNDNVLQAIFRYPDKSA